MSNTDEILKTLDRLEQRVKMARDMVVRHGLISDPRSGSSMPGWFTIGEFTIEDRNISMKSSKPHCGCQST